jgi:hypothetical protein
MAGILAELIREPHACSHIKSPKPPELLYGGDPTSLWGEAYAQAARAVDAAGDNLKSTALIIVVGVVTYPVLRSIVESDPKEMAKRDHWRQESISWVKKEFGTRLRLIVGHSDEAYDHFHFIALPTLGDDRRIRIGDVHPGHRAEQECKMAGGTKKEQKLAHQEAMTAFQDRHYEDVAVKFGFARFGPKRQHLRRSEWKAQKKTLAAVAASHEKARQYANDLKAAADRHVALRIADAQRNAEARAAEVEAAAARKIAQMKQQAVTRIKYFDARACGLEAELRHREELMSKQEERIRALEALLDEQSPKRGPGLN